MKNTESGFYFNFAAQGLQDFLGPFFFFSFLFPDFLTHNSNEEGMGVRGFTRPDFNCVRVWPHDRHIVDLLM